MWFAASGLIKTLEDIEHIVVKEVGGTPVYVRDVAEVRIGHAVRHGAAVVNGKHEVITGIVLMLRGGNAREVVQSIKDKIDEIHRSVSCLMVYESFRSTTGSS